jgi:hypothetical protein
MFFVVDEETRNTYCPGIMLRIWRVLQAAGLTVERYGRPVPYFEAEGRGFDRGKRVYEVWFVVKTQNGEKIEIR